ncbi:hypothetical protein [Paenibacillus sp. L3-i20]|uniref:hypothetical protein n=1 Tax=Paenibacillus sp. L3-i20 TaxID=2905833 RepID=UPI001EE11BEA|nr:hypothetical protein [Paenibacillus sp. L3-i20]GKU76309.1 hypothetical protein L3i20_v207060 [Paenibacillus sp. L3-i20]
MKIIILITLIISGMMGGYAVHHNSTNLQSHVNATNVTNASNVTKITDKIEIAPNEFSTDAILAKENVKEQSKLKKQFKLKNVNGLDLYDSPKSMIKKLGQPDDIQQDELFAEIDIYYYPSMRVAFSDDMIRYVEYDGDIGELVIDNVPVTATIDAIKSALGEPNYVTDDGIVFQRDEALLKLFINSDTGKLEFISYYHLASV